MTSKTCQQIDCKKNATYTVTPQCTTHPDRETKWSCAQHVYMFVHNGRDCDRATHVMPVITNQYIALAHLHIDTQVTNSGFEVTRVTVVPREGDAGYFGRRLSDKVWDGVSTYLENNLLDGEQYALHWEG